MIAYELPLCRLVPQRGRGKIASYSPLAGLQYSVRQKQTHTHQILTLPLIELRGNAKSKVK